MFRQAWKGSVLNSVIAMYQLQDLKWKCALFLEDMKFVVQWDNSDRSYIKYACRMVSICLGR